jgi:hypothetical protein
MTSYVLSDRSVALGLKVSLSAFHCDCLSRPSRLLSYCVRCGCNPWSWCLPRWSASHRMAVIVSQPREPPLTPTMSAAAAEHFVSLALCEDGFVTREELKAALEWAKTEEGKALYPAEDLDRAEALKNMPQVSTPRRHAPTARTASRLCPALRRTLSPHQSPSEHTIAHRRASTALRRTPSLHQSLSRAHDRPSARPSRCDARLASIRACPERTIAHQHNPCAATHAHPPSEPVQST